MIKLITTVALIILAGCASTSQSLDRTPKDYATALKTFYAGNVEKAFTMFMDLAPNNVDAATRAGEICRNQFQSRACNHKVAMIMYRNNVHAYFLELGFMFSSSYNDEPNSFNEGRALSSFFSAGTQRYKKGLGFLEHARYMMLWKRPHLVDQRKPNAWISGNTPWKDHEINVTRHLNYAIAEGNTEAYVYFGDYYSRYIVDELKNYELAISYYEKAIDSGKFSGHARLFELYSDKPNAWDTHSNPFYSLVEAKKHLDIIIENNKTEGFYLIGQKHFTGSDGYKKDINLAEEYFSKAAYYAERENLIYLSDIAFRYSNVVFGNVDYWKAIQYYLKSGPYGRTEIPNIFKKLSVKQQLEFKSLHPDKIAPLNYNNVSS